MRLFQPQRPLPVAAGILRAASFLVPRDARREWLAEWRSELWYVWRHCQGETQAWPRRSSEVTRFCLGAFHDALWLRQNQRREASRPCLSIESPLRCELLLATLAAASLLLAFALPGVRKVMEPSPYGEASRLITIARTQYSGSPGTAVQLADYRSWAQTTHHLFTALAFYQPVRKRVRIGKDLSDGLSIARGSSNLFSLLHLPVAGENTIASSSQPKAILSRELWRTSFHSDPQVVGKMIRVGGQQAAVAGILAGEDWPLPGHIDLWLLESEAKLAALPPSTEGVVLAEVVPSAFRNPPNGPRQMTVFRGSSGEDVFDCVSLAEQGRQPLHIFLFTLLLACLALPATTSLPLGEYPAREEPLPWTIKVRRWAFLATKTGWIVAIVYCASLDMAYGSESLSVPQSQYMQLVSSFFPLLFAFRWALKDQRKRCPVCLRSLSNPARVGHASQNFLAWNGTELVCLGGHGLLHVPDSPTSWFSTQRWLYLDPSWSGLFGRSYISSTGAW